MDKNEIVYVCYVLDGMGLLKGEEVVSCLTVTQSQIMVDKWLDDQLAEARENGYHAEENAEDFKGCSDYSFAVSKGNDREGYDTYHFICRTEVVK